MTMTLVLVDPEVPMGLRATVSTRIRNGGTTTASSRSKIGMTGMISKADENGIIRVVAVRAPALHSPAAEQDGRAIALTPHSKAEATALRGGAEDAKAVAKAAKAADGAESI